MSQEIKEFIPKNKVQNVRVDYWTQKIYQKINKQHLAFILVFLSTFFYPLGFIYSNQNNINSYQTALVRGIALLLFTCFLSWRLDIALDFRNPKNWRIMMIRSSIVLIQGIYYAGIQFYLTQPIVQTLNSTGPLFVFLIDYKVNNVNVTKIQLIGIIIGIIGVLLTVNGQLIMFAFDNNYTTQTTFQNYQTNNPFFQLLVGLIYIIIEIFWAWAMVMTKQMVGIDFVQINFHFGAFSMLVTGILYPLYVPQRIDPVKIFWAFIFGGIPIALAGLLFNAGLTMSHKTGSLTILIFFSVIIGYFLSIFRYNQNINPICSIGSVLIMYGLFQTILKKTTLEQLTNSKSTKQNHSSQLIK